MRVAIFGCGQLAKMMAEAGRNLRQEFVFVAEPNEDTRCVDGLGEIVVFQPGHSAEVLYQQLQQPDVVTVEKEMVDVQLLNELQTLTAIYPPHNAVYLAQNRIREKQFLRANGIATADFEILQSLEQLQSLPERLGFPLYVKSAESGYDGYNQWCIRTVDELQQQSLLAAIASGAELIVEKHVSYLREVSVIAVRNQQGDIAAYPMMENYHVDGVLVATMVPVSKRPSALDIENEALNAITVLLNHLDYVGVLTMECFETERGLVVNELAPRVHNSGHWTIEGAATSQFENHCRAIAGMSLGNIELLSPSGLVNMLGKYGKPELFSGETPTKGLMYYHQYGKQERPRRKLGHISVSEQSEVALKASLNQILKELYQGHYSPLK